MLNGATGVTRRTIFAGTTSTSAVAPACVGAAAGAAAGIGPTAEPAFDGAAPLPTVDVGTAWACAGGWGAGVGARLIVAESLASSVRPTNELSARRVDVVLGG